MKYINFKLSLSAVVISSLLCACGGGSNSINKNEDEVSKRKVLDSNISIPSDTKEIIISKNINPKFISLNIEADKADGEISEYTYWKLIPNDISCKKLGYTYEVIANLNKKDAEELGVDIVDTNIVDKESRIYSKAYTKNEENFEQICWEGDYSNVPKLKIEGHPSVAVAGHSSYIYFKKGN